MHVRSRSPAEHLNRVKRSEQGLRRLAGGTLVIELIVVVGLLAGVIGASSGEAPPVAPSFFGAQTEPGDPTARAAPSAGNEGDVGAAGGERSGGRERGPDPAAAAGSSAGSPASPSPDSATSVPEPAAAPPATPAPEPAPAPVPAAAPAPEPAADSSSGGSAGSSNCEFTFEC